MCANEAVIFELSMLKPNSCWVCPGDSVENFGMKVAPGSLSCLYPDYALPYATQSFALPFELEHKILTSETAKGHKNDWKHAPLTSDYKMYCVQSLSFCKDL